MPADRSGFEMLIAGTRREISDFPWICVHTVEGVTSSRLIRQRLGFRPRRRPRNKGFFLNLCLDMVWSLGMFKSLCEASVCQLQTETLPLLWPKNTASLVDAHLISYLPPSYLPVSLSLSTVRPTERVHREEGNVCWCSVHEPGQRSPRRAALPLPHRGSLCQCRCSSLRKGIGQSMVTLCFLTPAGSRPAPHCK